MKKGLRNLLIGVFWLAVWQGISAAVGLNILLPGPVDTLRALIRLAGTAAFWLTAGQTLLRVAAGYALAVAAGVLLAALCHRFRGADALLSPLRTVIKATPVTSFIILVLLWIARARVPVFIAFLMVLPIVWTGVQEALAAVDANLLEMAAMYRFSAGKKLRYVYLPSIRPALTAACVTGLGFAWKSGIAAEVIARPEGAVGTQLYNAQIYLERADLFAWTLTVILLSLALEALIKAVARRGKGAAA
ncbi:MAG: ABC transporter permease subunit [Clostridia bacterium]|nr:ABC transporter permease subunit [Clostridia bacterium]